MSTMTKKLYQHKPETNPQIILAQLKDACERADLALEIIETLMDGKELDDRLKTHLEEQTKPVRKAAFPVRIPKDGDDFLHRMNVFNKKVNAQIGKASIALTGLYNASSQGNAFFARQWESVPSDVLEQLLPIESLSGEKGEVDKIKAHAIYQHKSLAKIHKYMREKTAFTCQGLFAQGIIPPSLRSNFEIATKPDMLIDAEMAAKIISGHTQQIAHKEMEIAEYGMEGAYSLLLDYSRRKDPTSLDHAHSMMTTIAESLDLRHQQFETWLEMGADNPIFIAYNPE
jgi:hypothetical protein